METVLGMVYLFAGNFAPEGYELCDGQVMQITQNTALFTLLGTVYGGDGRTTFALPKLSGPVEGMNYVISVKGHYPQRK